MRNNSWFRPVPRQRMIFTGRRRYSMLRIKLFSGSAGLLAMLMLCAVLLSGCQTLRTAPCAPPEIPKIPALSQPLPSESYSTQASKNIVAWQKRLDGTPATSKP